MKVEQVTSRGSISGNELSGQMSSEGEGLVHKSKTAKDSEVVGEGDGVIPSALMGRKPSKATSKKWQAKQTEKKPPQISTSTTEEGAERSADSKGVFSK